MPEGIGILARGQSRLWACQEMRVTKMKRRRVMRRMVGALRCLWRWVMTGGVGRVDSRVRSLVRRVERVGEEGVKVVEDGLDGCWLGMVEIGEVTGV